MNTPCLDCGYWGDGGIVMQVLLMARAHRLMLAYRRRVAQIEALSRG